jgi:hypothetical protein
MKRAHIPLKTKLAAALANHFIPHEDAKRMTEDQVLSLFQWHHCPFPVAAEGGDQFWNLMPVLIVRHRTITAEVDAKVNAKHRRITKQQEEFRRRLLAKDRGESRPHSRWPKRKLQSRNNLRRTK